MTVGPTGGLLGSLAGISSGSGSARLGLSQKGDLPSSGEPVGFCWFKVANARNRSPTCCAAIDIPLFRELRVGDDHCLDGPCTI